MIKITHLRLESDEELAPEDQDYARGSHISKKKKSDCHERLFSWSISS